MLSSCFIFLRSFLFFFFFFNDTATTEIYTLSLHDALPILAGLHAAAEEQGATHVRPVVAAAVLVDGRRDRKSTRLNSSHSQISYAVFCLKKKKKTNTTKHQIQRQNHEPQLTYLKTSLHQAT